VNPFDLTGPPFLVFYWTLSVIAALFVYWRRLQTDVAGAPATMVADPYALTYLRAGYPEVMRVALLALAQEGILAVNGINFTLASKNAPAPRGLKIRRPAVEQALIAHLTSQPATIDLIVIAGVGHEACESYRLALEELGYLRRKSAVTALSTTSFFIALLLAAVAFIKIMVAHSRGRANVGFLIVSAFVAFGFVRALGNRPGVLTTRGKQALEAAVALLAGARRRLEQASAALGAEELAWLAAAFGFSIFNFTPANFAFWPALAYQAGARDRAGNLVSTPSSSTWSSCSTTAASCGGGSSCGGGGGCGGGGCGGCGGE
jgi:uncharacterized protein (TIGR04222 family)